MEIKGETQKKQRLRFSDISGVMIRNDHTRIGITKAKIKQTLIEVKKEHSTKTIQ